MYAAETGGSFPLLSVDTLVNSNDRYLSSIELVMPKMYGATFQIVRWSCHFSVIARSFVAMASVGVQHLLKLTVFRAHLLGSTLR